MRDAPLNIVQVGCNYGRSVFLSLALNVRVSHHAIFLAQVFKAKLPKQLYSIGSNLRD